MFNVIQLLRITTVHYYTITANYSIITTNYYVIITTNYYIWWFHYYILFRKVIRSNETITTYYFPGQLGDGPAAGQEAARRPATRRSGACWRGTRRALAMVRPPRAGPRGGLRHLHPGGPMGGAEAVSVLRSTGTVVAAVSSVPSPSSPAALVLARRRLTPMVASEEAAAAAGWARRLLVEVVYSSLATRWRPRGPRADPAGGLPGEARGAWPPCQGQAQPPKSCRGNDTTLRARGAWDVGAGRRLEPGPSAGPRSRRSRPGLVSRRPASR